LEDPAKHLVLSKDQDLIPARYVTEEHAQDFGTKVKLPQVPL